MALNIVYSHGACRFYNLLHLSFMINPPEMLVLHFVPITSDSFIFSI